MSRESLEEVNLAKRLTKENEDARREELLGPGSDEALSEMVPIGSIEWEEQKAANFRRLLRMNQCCNERSSRNYAALIELARTIGEKRRALSKHPPAPEANPSPELTYCAMED